MSKEDYEHIDAQLKRLKKRAKELGINPSLIAAVLNGSNEDGPVAERVTALESILHSVKEKQLSPYFDESDLVENEILPLWGKIYTLCEKNAIPVLFAIIKSNIDDNTNMAMGNVLIGKRTDAKFQLAKELLSSKIRPIDVSGSDLLDMLSLLKKDKKECDCDECTAARTKEVAEA